MKYWGISHFMKKVLHQLYYIHISPKILQTARKTTYVYWYTLNKSSKWFIVHIWRVFQTGLFADEFYQKFEVESIIKTNNFVFVHLKSSCQYQFTKKTMAYKTKWRRKPE